MQEKGNYRSGGSIVKENNYHDLFGAPVLHKNTRGWLIAVPKVVIKEINPDHLIERGKRLEISGATSRPKNTRVSVTQGGCRDYLRERWKKESRFQVLTCKTICGNEDTCRRGGEG